MFDFTNRQWFCIIMTVIIAVTVYNVTDLVLSHRQLCSSVVAKSQ